MSSDCIDCSAAGIILAHGPARESVGVAPQGCDVAGYGVRVLMTFIAGHPDKGRRRNCARPGLSIVISYSAPEMLYAAVSGHDLAEPERGYTPAGTSHS